MKLSGRSTSSFYFQPRASMARHRKHECTAGRMDVLWKDYFRDPSLWYVNGSFKGASKSSSLRHKSTCQDLWIDGFYNPSWVNEALWRVEGLTYGMKDPEGFSFVSLLKACAKRKELAKGIKLHHDIQEKGLLRKSPYLASSLISMYSKCGVLSEAHRVLEELPVRDMVSWSALISGYVQHGLGHEALDCFERMKKDGFSPNGITFTSLLKACGSVSCIRLGEQIHDEIVSRGLLENDVVLGTALVGMYAKCGMLTKAQEVLEQLRFRDVVAWSALISGYAEEGQSCEALNCFERMKHEGLSPDRVTFVCLLKACGKTRSFDKGKQIHEEIASKGLLEKGDVVLGSALVDMYAKCGLLTRAQRVLEELPVRNVVSWSTLVSGYVQQGQFHEALVCFEQMQNEGHSPNSVTFIFLLKACGVTRAIRKAERIHERIVRENLLEKDIALATALIHMYAECGMLARAREVLEGLSVRSAASWNALVSGYAEQGQYLEALNCCEQMQREGLSPDVVTFTCLLKACGSTGSIDKGKEIHEDIIKRGLLRKDIQLGNAVVDMYAKCGVLAKAREVLEELHGRDVATWNTLIAGYVRQGLCNEALNCYERMQSDGLSTNATTYVCILKACGSAGAVDKGIRIHEEISGSGLLERNMLLGNALVDMYAKCGKLDKAQRALEELPIRTVVAWSSLLAGYARQSDGYNALMCFEQMQNEGISPNDVTFSCVLNACGHAGRLDDARVLFNAMNQKYKIRPNVEHQTCMMKIFGCEGRLGRVVAVTKAMPPASPAVWLALLGACWKWGEVKVGKSAFDQVIQIDAQLMS